MRCPPPLEANFISPGKGEASHGCVGISGNIHYINSVVSDPQRNRAGCTSTQGDFSNPRFES